MLSMSQTSKLLWEDLSLEDVEDTIWQHTESDSGEGNEETEVSASVLSQFHVAVVPVSARVTSSDVAEVADVPATTKQRRQSIRHVNIVAQGGRRVLHAQPLPCRTVHGSPVRAGNHPVRSSNLPVVAACPAMPTILEQCSILRLQTGACEAKFSPYDLRAFGRRYVLEEFAIRRVARRPWRLQLEIVYQFRPTLETTNVSKRFVSSFRYNV